MLQNYLYISFLKVYNFFKNLLIQIVSYLLCAQYTSLQYTDLTMLWKCVYLYLLESSTHVISNRVTKIFHPNKICNIMVTQWAIILMGLIKAHY